MDYKYIIKNMTHAQVKKRLESFNITPATGAGSFFANAAALSDETFDIRNKRRSNRETEPDESDFLAHTLSVINDIDDLNLINIHEMELDFDTKQDATYLKLLGDKFYDLLVHSLATSRIVLVLDVEDANGVRDTIWRPVTDENLRFFKKLMKNKGRYFDFSSILPESEADWLDRQMKVHRISIMNLDLAPIDMQPGRKKRSLAYWPYVFTGPEDLSPYQVFHSVDEIDTTNCFIYALKQLGVAGTTLINIETDIAGKKFVELPTIKRIAEKYGLNIWVHIKTPKRTNFPLKYGVINDHPLNLGIIDEHIFVFERVMFRGREMSSIQILSTMRRLGEMQAIDFSAVNDLKVEAKEPEVEFTIDEANFHDYEFKGIKTFKISGNFLNAVNKCKRGNRLIASIRKHIREPVVFLDVNSLYPYAAKLVGVHTDKPKVFEKSMSVEEVVKLYESGLVTNAFVLVHIDYVEHSKYELIKIDNDRPKGHVWLTLIDLVDLCRFNKLRGTVVGGFYFDTPTSHELDSYIDELYQQRKTNPGAKLTLNKMLGKTMVRAVTTKRIDMPTQKILPFIVANFRQVHEARIGYVEVYKRHINHSNLAHFGVSVLAMARHIMREVVNYCETHGIDVFYSCVDSICIRKKDLAELTRSNVVELGGQIGAFKIETSAQEAVFIRKGMYACKLDDGSYKFRGSRDVTLTDDEQWEAYMSKLR